MKITKVMPLLLSFTVLFTACEKDEEVLTNNLNNSGKKDISSVSENLEVEDFVYRGMNDIYLYKANVPELADTYFSNNNEKEEYLAGFSSPENLFKALKYSQDRFSFITDDYEALEESFKGISSGVAGMEFGLGRITGTNNIFAFLQYVAPETSADKAGLKRGTVFTEVNGQKLTLDNFQNLLNSDSFTINTGYVQDGQLVLTGETVTLSHSQYTENPILIAKTLDVDGRKVVYLMYNSFVGDFDDELNEAFGQFKSDGIQDLVLDLRYNGGGSVESAIDLASMITGQFKGEIFMKERWNEDYQKYFESKDPEYLINRFDSQIRTSENINSLNLTKVYVLTSERTASASELVINGLKPYITVVQVGATTTGKFQASVTLYDSDNFKKEGASKNHKYALQPLVFKSANAAGKTDYINGLTPDVLYKEDIGDFGELGDPSEPLLQAALNHLTGKAQATKNPEARKFAEKFETVGNSGMLDLNYQRMYTEKLPPLDILK